MSQYDLIVVGGGIHGMMVADLAAERGYKTVLIEKGTLGGATSQSWYRILHGGLRYLQSLDIRRFRESVTERRWFLQTFGDYLQVQPYLMPLYGKGLKRAEIFRIAFLLDALMGFDRNVGARGLPPLKRGRVLSSAAVREAFPTVLDQGLAGGALWEEAVVPDTDALTAAIVDRLNRWDNLDILQHHELVRLELRDGEVAGAVVASAESETLVEASAIINAAGPWAESLAARLDPSFSPSHGHSLAFNLILDLPPPSRFGVSIAPPRGTSDMLFLYPLDGKTFAGTWYVPHRGSPDEITPSQTDIEAFLAALNASQSGPGFRPEHILKVMPGLLPTTALDQPKLLGQDRIIDHARAGGPKGLITSLGVKYTTARSVARQSLARAELRLK